MINNDEFKNYYENQLKPISNLYIAETRKTLFICITMGVILIFVSVFFYNVLNNILALFMLMLIFVLIIEGKRKYSCILKEYKYQITYRIIAFLSNNKNVIFEENVRIAKTAVEDCQLFNTELLRIFGNHYTVMKKGKFNITLSDLKLSDVSGKWEKDIFNGIYMAASFNKPIREQVYAIPNNIKDVVINSFMNYLEYAGVRVILENNEFERKYNVYSVDELQARYLISLRLMERINDIDKIFPGKKYIIFKKTGKISVLFSGESIRNELDKSVNLLFSNEDKRFCEEVFKYFNKFLEVYKILDLENRLYMIGVWDLNGR